MWCFRWNLWWIASSFLHWGIIIIFFNCLQSIHTESIPWMKYHAILLYMFHYTCSFAFSLQNKPNYACSFAFSFWNTCVEYPKFVIVMFIIAIASYCSKPTTFSSDIQEEGKYIHKTSLWPSYHYKIVASFINTGRQHFVGSINSRIPYLNDSNRTSILVEYFNSIIRWDKKKSYFLVICYTFRYLFIGFWFQLCISVCYRFASLSNSFYSLYNKLLLSKR